MLSTESKLCPDCGHNGFDFDRSKGEVTCKKCALVVDESMMDTVDYVYSEENKKMGLIRTGAPYDVRIVDNLRTSVGKKSDMIKIERKCRYKMERLYRVNIWDNGSYYHTLRSAFNILTIFSSKLSIPEFVEKETANIFRQCVMKGVTKKRSIESILVASLYMATRIHNIPRSMNEIARITKIDKHVIGKISKEIVRTFRMKNHHIDAIDYVPRFASDLKLSAKVQTRAVELIELSRKHNLLIGLSPLSIAGTFLYIASLDLKEYRTQREFALVSDITEATLRTRYKKFIAGLGMKNMLKG